MIGYNQHIIKNSPDQQIELLSLCLDSEAKLPLGPESLSFYNREYMSLCDRAWPMWIQPSLEFGLSSVLPSLVESVS